MKYLPCPGHQEPVRQMTQEQNALIDLMPDLNATAEEARARMLADGVRPEDNLFSCGIIADRDIEYFAEKE